MGQVIAVLLAIATFAVVSTLHFLVVAWLHKRLMKIDGRPFAIVFTALWGLAISHLVGALIYALVVFGAISFEIGDLTGEAAPYSLLDTFYFSLVNYTALGLGDIIPIGDLRLLLGIEALNGFLLISISAALLFAVMKKASEDL